MKSTSMTSDNTTTHFCWDKNIISQVKEMYANTLNETEFMTFIQIGKSTNLNPFLREIWAVKYGNNTANIFIGRDGYRKVAQENPDYDYHHSDAVYSNDSFSIKNCEVSHEYSGADRGNLIGAYCIVKRKNSSKPFFNYVEIKEYSTGKSLWGSKPATMIKKVAEAQCLRMAFQSIFCGTYDESENWKNDTNIKLENTEHYSKIYDEDKKVDKNNITFNPSIYEMVSEFKSLAEEKHISQEVIQKALEKENVTSIGDLPLPILAKWIEKVRAR